eukprot:403370318
MFKDLKYGKTVFKNQYFEMIMCELKNADGSFLVKRVHPNICKVMYEDLFPTEQGLALDNQLVKYVNYMQFHFSCTQKMTESDDNHLQEIDEKAKYGLTKGLKSLDKFYVPPEARKRQMVGYKSDIWNVGLLLCFMLGGSIPFDTIEDLDNNYYEDQFDQPNWKDISVEAKDFIDHLLEADPLIRFTALQALNHPWIVYNSPPPDINMNQDEDDELQQEIEFQDRLRQAMNKKRQESSRNTFSLKEDLPQNSNFHVELIKMPQSTQPQNDYSVVNNSNQSPPQNITNSNRQTLGATQQSMFGFDKKLNLAKKKVSALSVLSDMSKLRTKIFTLHKKSSQIYMKSLFQELDDDEDMLISKQDICKYLKIQCHKAEEMFSFGDCNQNGQLGFINFIKAIRSQLENDLVEWFKIAIGDEALPLQLEDFKIVLSESKYFPISEDLEEIFKELEIYMKSLFVISEEQSLKETIPKQKPSKFRNKQISINESFDRDDVEENQNQFIKDQQTFFSRTITKKNISQRSAMDSSIIEQSRAYVYDEFLGHLFKMSKQGIKLLQ